MSHLQRVERHISVDILAGSLGASAIGAISSKSLLLAGLTLLIGVVLWLLERRTIEEEDKIEALVAPPKSGKTAADRTYAYLSDLASREMTKLTSKEPEVLSAYNAGLNDGTTILADLIVNGVTGDKNA